MKKSRLAGGVSVVFAVVVMAAGGCGPDPKERIAMLEDGNRALTDEVNLLQSELDQLRSERDACRAELAGAQNLAANLRNQLAAKPKERVPEGWTAVPGGAMIAIEGSALFDSGKPTIRKGSKRILDSIASAVQGEYPAKDVLVFGHTDNVPIKLSGWKDNWELSAQRALSVVRYMASHGIAPQRLVACGSGEHRPIASNATKRGRQQNRRVEIFVLDPQPRTGMR